MITQLKRRNLVHAALASGLAFAGLPARAAPAALGRVYYGYPAGSMGSKVGGIVVRELQGLYKPDLGTELTVLPGDANTRAVEAAHAGPADGSTVLYTPSSVLTLLPLVRTLRGIDLAADFTAVAPLVEFTFAFTVGPAVPTEVRTMKDYLRWVRDNPQGGDYGVPGLGTAPHLVGMSLARRADRSLRAVAYQGMAPMTRDLQAGALPAGIAILGALNTASGSGALRPLAVTSVERWPSMPDLPTFRELGLSDINVTETFGFHMPSATPKAKLQELNAAVQQCLRSPTLAALLEGSLLRTVQTTPEAYADAITRERTAWRDIVRQERFTLQS